MSRREMARRGLGRGLVLLLGVAAHGPGTTLAAPCTAAGQCTDNTGHVWDMSSVGAEQSTTPAAPDPTWNTYSIQLYANLNPVPPACTNAGKLAMNAAVYNSGVGASDCAQIGPDVSQDSPTLTASGDSLVFQYTFQDATTGTNVLKVTMTCGDGLGNPGPVTATDQGGGTGWLYTTAWTSSAACKDGDGPGGGESWEWAWPFIYIVGGTVAAYLVLGVIVQRRANPQASGWSNIPHNGFWRALGSLVDDGIGYALFSMNPKTRYAAIGEGGTATFAQAPAMEVAAAQPRVAEAEKDDDDDYDDDYDDGFDEPAPRKKKRSPGGGSRSKKKRGSDGEAVSRGRGRGRGKGRGARKSRSSSGDVEEGIEETSRVARRSLEGETTKKKKKKSFKKKR